MKSIFIFLLLLFSNFIFSQIIHERFFGSNIDLNFHIKQNSINIEDLKPNHKDCLLKIYESKYSFLHTNENLLLNKLNQQFKNLNFKTLEKKMDFDSFMTQCGVFQLTSSKDLMIGAIKNYILNKYILSLFAKTDYN